MRSVISASAARSPSVTKSLCPALKLTSRGAPNFARRSAPASRAVSRANSRSMVGAMGSPPFTGSAGIQCPRRLRLVQNGEHHRENAPQGTGVLQPDSAAVLLQNLAAQPQAHPHAAEVAGVRVTGAVKALEELPPARWDADPLVA